MRFLSLNKRNNLRPKLFDCAEIFRFARLPLILRVQIGEKPVLKIFGDRMWEKESIIDVQWRQENRNPRFPRVGIFLSPLNTIDGFYLSHPCYLTPGSASVVYDVTQLCR